MNIKNRIAFGLFAVPLLLIGCDDNSKPKTDKDNAGIPTTNAWTDDTYNVGGGSDIDGFSARVSASFHLLPDGSCHETVITSISSGSGEGVAIKENDFGGCNQLMLDLVPEKEKRLIEKYHIQPKMLPTQNAMTSKSAPEPGR